VGWWLGREENEREEKQEKKEGEQRKERDHVCEGMKKRREDGLERFQRGG